MFHPFIMANILVKYHIKIELNDPAINSYDIKLKATVHTCVFRNTSRSESVKLCVTCSSSTPPTNSVSVQ